MAGKHPKPYESPLSAHIAQDILNIPIPAGEDGPPARTIGERVRRALEAIEEANRHLATSPVAKIVAHSIMQTLKKRGEATIAVRSDGAVVLRVAYGAEEGPTEVRSRRDAPSVQTTHRSDLPYLDELRAEAADLGLDISGLGRRRRTIHEYIEAHKRNAKGFDQVSVSAAPEAGTLPGRRRSGVPGRPLVLLETEAEATLEGALAAFKGNDPR